MEEKEAEKIIATLEKIAKAVDEDPNMWKSEEEFQRKYGTLTGEDLRKTFTI